MRGVVCTYSLLIFLVLALKARCSDGRIIIPQIEFRSSSSVQQGSFQRASSRSEIPTPSDAAMTSSSQQHTAALPPLLSEEREAALELGGNEQHVDARDSSWAAYVRASGTVKKAEFLAPDSEVRWFDGLLQQTSSIPPDGAIATGLGVVACFANGEAGLYKEDTFERIGNTVSLRSFHGVPDPPTDNESVFDPRALFDYDTGRFVVVSTHGTGNSVSNAQYAFSKANTAPSAIQGSDWEFLTIGLGTAPRWADYPHIGIGKNNFYLTVNLFDRNAPGSNPQHSFVLAVLVSFPKAKMYDGSLAQADVVSLALPEFTHVPGTVLRQPTDNVIYLVNELNGGAGSYHLLSVVDQAVPSIQDAGTFNGGPYNQPLGGVPQIGGDPVISNDARISGPVFQVDSKLYLCHTFEKPGTATVAVRWFEVDAASASILQSGELGDADNQYFFPGIGADLDGNIGIITSSGGPNKRIGVVWFYHQAGDEKGSMRGPFSVADSNAPVTIERWGDYAAMTVDPSTGRMWAQSLRYTTESGSDWQLVAVDGCPGCKPAIDPILAIVLIVLGSLAVLGAIGAAIFFVNKRSKVEHNANGFGVEKKDPFYAAPDPPPSYAQASAMSGDPYGSGSSASRMTQASEMTGAGTGAYGSTTRAQRNPSRRGGRGRNRSRGGRSNGSRGGNRSNGSRGPRSRSNGNRR